MDDNLKNMLRSVPSCDECRKHAEKFGEGKFRLFALSCAAETDEYYGCNSCLETIVEVLRQHESTKR